MSRIKMHPVDQFLMEAEALERAGLTEEAEKYLLLAILKEGLIFHQQQQSVNHILLTKTQLTPIISNPPDP